MPLTSAPAGSLRAGIQTTRIVQQLLMESLVLAVLDGDVEPTCEQRCEVDGLEPRAERAADRGSDIVVVDHLSAADGSTVEVVDQLGETLG